MAVARTEEPADALIDSACPESGVERIREIVEPAPSALSSQRVVWFAGNDAIRFYVGKAGSTVKFEKPGSYDYTVHVTGSKVHSHTGTVVVK